MFCSGNPRVLSISPNARVNIRKISRLKSKEKYNRDVISKELREQNKTVKSSHQTKEWRKQVISKNDGQKDSGCEKYQRSVVERITGVPCIKRCGTRINQRTLELRHNNLRCMTNKGVIIDDGFDWTEDFDGYQSTVKGIDVYYNFKFVCGKGGAQTRTLREVYHFVEAQLKYLLSEQRKDDIKKRGELFINILDGDQSHNCQPYFEHLLSRPEYITIVNKCFVGDSRSFAEYYYKTRHNL